MAELIGLTWRADFDPTIFLRPSWQSLSVAWLTAPLPAQLALSPSQLPKRHRRRILQAPLVRSPQVKEFIAAFFPDRG
jgi:hypothetical protein